jgi:tRNA U34 5-methylaminomethyl-2-thiouridine-forming methyltransferase MnmC
MSLILQSTGDNSHTLFSEVFGENYHSRHGALQESEHVFIKNGLEHIEIKDTLHILEVGMGTGLNVLLTVLHPLVKDFIVYYTAIEPYPVASEIAEMLNYPDMMQDKKTAKQLFYSIHNGEPNRLIQLQENFFLYKAICQLQQFSTDNLFDLVYFDAFAPSRQAEMWEESIFRKLAAIIKPSGILVTYCAKGVFKRILKETGFEVERLPGPPGKREMTRATLLSKK